MHTINVLQHFPTTYISILPIIPNVHTLIHPCSTPTIHQLAIKTICPYKRAGSWSFNWCTRDSGLKPLAHTSVWHCCYVKMVCFSELWINLATKGPLGISQREYGECSHFWISHIVLYTCKPPMLKKVIKPSWINQSWYIWAHITYTRSRIAQIPAIILVKTTMLIKWV